MAELGALSLELGVDLAPFNAGLARAQQLAQQAGQDIAKRLDARRQGLALAERQLADLQARSQAQPWMAGKFEPAIRALEQMISRQRESIRLLEQGSRITPAAPGMPAAGRGGGGAGADLAEGLLGGIPGGAGALAALTNPYVAVGAALTGIATASVMASNNITKLEQQLTLLTGSGEATNYMLDELRSYAQATPFDLPGLAESAKLLMAYGIESGRVVDYVRRLGDISTVTGTDLNRLALNFGQIISAGQAYDVDLRQFAMAGVPIYEELARVTGKSVGELKMMREAMPAEWVIKAFDNMTSAGGKFYEGGIKGGTALDREWASLGDTVTMFNAELGKVIAPTVVEAIKLIASAVGDLKLALQAAAKAGADLRSKLPKPLTNYLDKNNMLKDPRLAFTPFAAAQAVGSLFGMDVMNEMDYLLGQGRKGLQQYIGQKPSKAPPVLPKRSGLSAEQEKLLSQARQKAQTAADELAAVTSIAGLENQALQVQQQRLAVSRAMTDAAKAYSDLMKTAFGSPERQAAILTYNAAIDNARKLGQEARNADILANRQSRDQLGQSLTRLRFSEQFGMLAGPGRQIADQILNLQQASSSFAKATQQFDMAAQQNLDPLQLQTAANTLATAGISVRQAMVDGAITAKNALKSAADAMRAAQLGAFDILPTGVQAGLFGEAITTINRGIDQGLVDPRKLGQFSQGGYNLGFGGQTSGSYVNFAGQSAQAVLALADKVRNLQDAQQAQQQAQAMAQQLQATQANTAALVANTQTERRIVVTVNGVQGAVAGNLPPGGGAP